MKEIYGKHILIIDDEADIRELLETILKKEGFQNVQTAQNGKEALQLCREHVPDLIVLDIMLPDIDGYEICRDIREYSMVPIIFLSAKSEEIDRLLSFALGGDDYITKPFSPKEAVYRIKAILKREQYHTRQQSSLLRIRNLEIDETAGIVRKHGQVLTLTALEYKLLLYFVHHKNMILSKSKILDNVWESDFDGFDNTLMVHIRRLRGKIEDDPSNPRYIRTIRKMGYKFTDE